MPETCQARPRELLSAGFAGLSKPEGGAAHLRAAHSPSRQTPPPRAPSFSTESSAASQRCPRPSCPASRVWRWVPRRPWSGQRQLPTSMARQLRRQRRHHRHLRGRRMRPSRRLRRVVCCFSSFLCYLPHDSLQYLQRGLQVGRRRRSATQQPRETWSRQGRAQHPICVLLCHYLELKHYLTRVHVPWRLWVAVHSPPRR